jgi:hypothetical protein
MPTHRSTPVATITAGLVGLAILMTGCSSSPETEVASGEAASASPQPQTMTSQVACDKYYEFDLFRRAQVPSTQEAGRAERRQALADYQELASRMAVSLDSSVIVGDLPARARVNANRIVRQLTRVTKAGGDISDVTGPAEARIARSAQRIESLCVSTDHPVPPENLAARSTPENG